MTRGRLMKEENYIFSVYEIFMRANDINSMAGVLKELVYLIYVFNPQHYADL